YLRPARDPAKSSVGTNDSELDIPARACFDPMLGCRPKSLPVIGMNQSEEVLPCGDPRRRVDAQDGAIAVRPHDTLGQEVGFPVADAGGFHRELELRLTLAQRRFGALALGELRDLRRNIAQQLKHRLVSFTHRAIEK